MDIEASEQAAFLPEQVETILMQAIELVLKNEVYGELVSRSRLLRCSTSIRYRIDANLDLWRFLPPSHRSRSEGTALGGRYL
jgi:hypothetical protein